MNLKQQVYTVLRNPNFPNLQFLFSKETLSIAPEILEELLEQEKSDFQTKLTTPDSEITFETFDDISQLDYFFGLLEHYQGVNNDEVMRKIIEDFEPKYIDFSNEVSYSKRYYEMLVYCHENTSLTPQQERIIEKSIEAYQIRGIALDRDEQEKLKSINKTLSELSQKFANNALDSQNEFEYILPDEGSIAEMPQDDRDSAAKKSREKGKKGYLFDASGSSYIAIMKYCNDRKVRKDFYNARNSFATTGKHNNTPIILDILSARKAKAEILGFQNYSELSLHFKMAESADQIIELLSDISRKAQQKAQQEINEIQEYFGLTKLEPYDLGYYSRKLKQEKYELDDRELKKYFVFENVLSGMFEIIYKLYGLEFTPIKASMYEEGVCVYEVKRQGNILAYFFTDYFYRPLKRQGAWANILRENFEGNKKIVVNVANFQKGAGSETLLTLNDVETMFHEFGHATHEILSTSPHSELSGFHVEWDFVELPSQLLENWCRHPDGLALFAKHYISGEPLPYEIIDALKKLETFGNGNMLIKQNEYALLDILLHTHKIPQNQQELQDLVKDNYQKNSLFNMPDTYSPHTTFSHIFDGGYASGYYSYIWAEIIEKEVWKKFIDSGDIFDPETAKSFHNTILSQGTTKDAKELFRDFMKRDIQIEAFLSEKGLI